VLFLTHHFQDDVWTIDICERVPYVLDADISGFDAVVCCGTSVKKCTLNVGNILFWDKFELERGALSYHVSAPFP
jgi:coenzyme F420-reducing hydrogenase delta subunit